jgi:hypothetical protein
LRQPGGNLCLALIPAAFVLAVPRAAAAKGLPSPLSGIFSNVEGNPNSGDLHGTEIEIHAEGAQPYALVTLCQGWCNQSHHVPVTIKGNQFELSFAEHYVDQAGAPVETATYRITGHLVGRGLRIRNSGYSPEVDLLKRRTKRFGLAVARPAPAE